MKKLGILVMSMVLVVGMSVGVMALTNPFAEDAKVDVTINVNEMAEMWTTLSNATLSIERADAYITDDGKASDTVTYLSNVPVAVSVQLDSHIPDYTEFHVIVNPHNPDEYTSVNDSRHTDVSADNIITWDKRDGTYQQGSINTSYEAFTDGANTSMTSMNVDYAVAARHVMPEDNTDTTTTVIWTISANN